MTWKWRNATVRNVRRGVIGCGCMVCKWIAAADMTGSALFDLKTVFRTEGFAKRSQTGGALLAPLLSEKTACALCFNRCPTDSPAMEHRRPLGRQLLSDFGRGDLGVAADQRATRAGSSSEQGDLGRSGHA
jgi:hypothetical protein